jgi:hypothetical protein
MMDRMGGRIERVCQGCRAPLDPIESDVVQAFELIPVASRGGAGAVEGGGVYFHEGCFVRYPFRSGYRLSPADRTSRQTT